MKDCGGIRRLPKSLRNPLRGKRDGGIKNISSGIEKMLYFENEVITTSDILATNPEVDEGEGEWSIFKKGRKK